MPLLSWENARYGFAKIQFFTIFYSIVPNANRKHLLICSIFPSYDCISQTLRRRAEPEQIRIHSAPFFKGESNAEN